MSRKSQVNAYLAKEKIKASDLIFAGPRRGKMEPNHSGHNYEKVLQNPASTIRELILAVLKLSIYNCSFPAEKGRFETYGSARRSVLDIWRHIKYYRPEVTIFEVMSTIKNMNNEIRGWYCMDVKRRVFWCWMGSGAGISNGDSIDEFGLLLNEWDNIHLEEE